MLDLGRLLTTSASYLKNDGQGLNGFGDVNCSPPVKFSPCSGFAEKVTASEPFLVVIAEGSYHSKLLVGCTAAQRIAPHSQAHAPSSAGQRPPRTGRHRGRTCGRGSQTRPRRQAPSRRRHSTTVPCCRGRRREVDEGEPAHDLGHLARRVRAADVERAHGRERPGHEVVDDRVPSAATAVSQRTRE
jgi:hypothetical protein